MYTWHISGYTVYIIEAHLDALPHMVCWYNSQYVGGAKLLEYKSGSACSGKTIFHGLGDCGFIYVAHSFLCCGWLHKINILHKISSLGHSLFKFY